MLRFPPKFFSLGTASKTRCWPQSLLPQAARRALHLAPPYLLDDYIPRYHLISSLDAARKRSEAYAHLRNCNLCPRLCGVNRYEKTGTCLIGAETVSVNTIGPHFGEGDSYFFRSCVLDHSLMGSRTMYPGTQRVRLCLLLGLQSSLRLLPEPRHSTPAQWLRPYARTACRMVHEATRGGRLP